MSEPVLDLLQRDLYRCQSERAALDVEVAKLRERIRELEIKASYITEMMQRLGFGDQNSPQLLQGLVIDDKLREYYQSLPPAEFLRRMLIINGTALGLDEFATLALKFSWMGTSEKDLAKIKGNFSTVLSRDARSERPLFIRTGWGKYDLRGRENQQNVLPSGAKIDMNP
jgi:hypothetical protein